VRVSILLMKGHVPTPDNLADHIVERLFCEKPPERGDRILYPGLGNGPFVLAVERYCEDRNYPVPKGVGIEQDPDRIEEAEELHEESNLEIIEGDFLTDFEELGTFEFIVGNPPYVPIEGLSEDEKSQYKKKFATARDRFDLYLLFFEQGLSLLNKGGRLTYITPEKYEYVGTAERLREMLIEHDLELIEHLDEDVFEGYITFPTITRVTKTNYRGETQVIRRDGSEESVELPPDGESWASTIRAGETPTLDSGVVLGDICERISCGVATGADRLFVQKRGEVPEQLLGDWTYPTVSGKGLRHHDGPKGEKLFICPYQEDGRLPEEDELGEFGDWAELHRSRLEDRSCVKKGKRPWYGWHENPPMEDILQPKLLCQDITSTPKFWVDREGDIVPKHTVYYLVPEDHVQIDELLEYLNSDEATAWLEANCQRAANGFYRLQTRVMQELPVPEKFGETIQETLV
jgi:adenine-specific DNA-methyltransferase